MVVADSSLKVRAELISYISASVNCSKLSLLFISLLVTWIRIDFNSALEITLQVNKEFLRRCKHQASYSPDVFRLPTCRDEASSLDKSFSYSDTSVSERLNSQKEKNNLWNCWRVNYSPWNNICMTLRVSKGSLIFAISYFFKV